MKNQKWLTRNMNRLITKDIDLIEIDFNYLINLII